VAAAAVATLSLGAGLGFAVPGATADPAVAVPLTCTVGASDVPTTATITLTDTPDPVATGADLDATIESALALSLPVTVEDVSLTMPIPAGVTVAAAADVTFEGGNAVSSTPTINGGAIEVDFDYGAGVAAASLQLPKIKVAATAGAPGTVTWKVPSAVEATVTGVGTVPCEPDDPDQALATTTVIANTSDVYVVHGIGDDLAAVPAQNPVDVYAKAKGPGNWGLVLEDFAFGEISPKLELTPGDYNVLICTAVPDPADSIAACQDNGGSAVNGNSGTDATVPGPGKSITLVAALSPERPTVLGFENDLTCVDPGREARLTGIHAADAGTATVSVNGSAVDDIDFGQGLTADLAPGTYDIDVSDGAALDLSLTDVALAKNTLTNAFVVGTADGEGGYGAIVQQFDVATCEQPPPSSTTTTTQTPPTTARATPVAARPVYTG
jgi:hypothetical protein